MLGTIVNSAAIIVGTFLGILLKTGIPDKIKHTIMQGIGLSVMLIGLSMAMKTQNVIIVILSLVIGGIIGEVFAIEDRLKNAGEWLEERVGQNQGDFTRGFVTTSLIFCVGAMAIMGALESGLTGNHTTLFAKSALDGITSIVFASSMGIGVAFSALPVFIYQGLITLTAASMKVFLTDAIIREMTATGGVLILGIGLNILEITKIKVGNMLPAIIGAVFLTVLMARFPF
ncbi:putative membrane protein YdfK [Koleobacter methoxysyntrophicus]|jgi:hypothetical protein|uniref:Putative membrane protein YdfK n=1 Tax=Koleobacter methoxysyntrophicus TaxID=2751313 RepID=A0A8A0RJX7_9FIRM|nr:DUF554 domain-containing protein [Koleobacter methoxysyntrophicus]QSQ08645.1 putative membrane protein YdfK [Koleobacter methoxysyntrophicus]